MLLSKILDFLEKILKMATPSPIVAVIKAHLYGLIEWQKIQTTIHLQPIKYLKEVAIVWLSYSI
jgi:hypothetical protein